MKVTVYTLEDFREDCEHGVIGVYGSFEKAKIGLIEALKEEIMSCEDELDEYEDDEVDGDDYAKGLRDSIDNLNELIKRVEKAIPNPYYTCHQLYITEHAIN